MVDKKKRADATMDVLLDELERDLAEPEDDFELMDDSMEGINIVESAELASVEVMLEEEINTELVLDSVLPKAARRPPTEPIHTQSVPPPFPTQGSIPPSAGPPKAAPPKAPPPKAGPPKSGSHAPRKSIAPSGTQVAKASVPPPIPTQNQSVAAPTRKRNTKAPPPAPTEQTLGAAKEMIQRWTRVLAEEPEARRSATLNFEIARLYESPLANLKKALTHYQAALVQRADHLPAIRGARRVLLELANFKDSVPLFDAEIRVSSDAKVKARLLLAKGRVLEDRLNDHDAAHRAYSTAWELDRTDPTILHALEQHYLATSQLVELDRIYEASANAVAADHVLRAGYIVLRARLAEMQGRLDRATDLYETALKLHEHAPGAINALKRLHHSQNRWRDLVRVLEVEATQSDDPAVQLLAFHRIADGQRNHLGNQDEALVALRHALTVSPEDVGALSQAADLYASVGRPEDLSEVLKSLVRLSKRSDEQHALLLRLGRVFEEQLRQDGEAIRCYESALRLMPNSEPVHHALHRMYHRLENWESLLKLKGTVAEHSEDALGRATAYASMAELLETKMRRDDDAIEHHQRALAAVPSFPPSFKALTRLLSAAGRHRDSIELYDRATELAEHPQRKISYLFQIGRTYETDLKEPKYAAQTYRRILEVDAQHLGAVHALQRACEQGKRYDEYHDALELELALTESADRRVTLLHRMGEVQSTQLKDQERGISYFRQSLDLDSSYMPALRSLAALFEAAGRWEDLLEIYEKQLSLADAGPDGIAILSRMAELCSEQIGRDDLAMQQLQRILDLDPGHAPALKELTGRLADRSAFPELVEVLKSSMACAELPSDKANFAQRIGEIYEVRLEDSDQALDFYQQALKLLPAHRPSLESMIRLQARCKDWQSVVKLLAQSNNTTQDMKIALQNDWYAAQIYDGELKQSKQAIQAYERVLSRDPEHIGALLALRDLYRQSASWDKLDSVYQQLSELVQERQLKLTTLRELARLRAMRKGDDPNLKRIYYAILDILPSDTAALLALEAIALRNKDLHLLRQVDERLAQTESKPGVRAAHQTRLAETLESLAAAEQDDAGLSDALAGFRNALILDPQNLAASAGLSRVAQTLGDPRALVEAARQEADVSQDLKQAARLLLRSARVRVERMHDENAAAEDLKRAISYDPDQVESAEMLHMLLSRKLPAELCDVLTHAAGAATQPARVSALWLTVADLQANQLKNNGAAIASLHRVLRQEPNHFPALKILAHYYEQDGQWNEAADALNRIVKMGSDRNDLREAHLSLARLWDEKLGDSGRSLVSLQSVISIDSRNQEALLRLSRIHEKEGRIVQSVDAAAKLLKSATSSAERATALIRLARLENSRGNDVAGAEAIREAVTIEGPGSESALECKAQIDSSPGWLQYIDALRSHLAGVSMEDGQRRAGVHLEIARVQQDHLEDTNSAISTLRNGYKETKNPLLHRELAGRLRAAGRHDDAIKELSNIVFADLVNAEAWRELAHTYKAAGMMNHARLATSPLRVLNQVSKTDRALADAPPHPARAKAGSLAASVLDSLGTPTKAQQSATELLNALAPALPKLYPPDLEGHGLSNKDKLGTKSGHPLRALAGQLAEILDVGEFEIYAHRARNRGMSVEMGNTPLILVPTAVQDLPLAQRVFLLTRPLVNIARGFHAVDKLTPRELEVLLASATRVVSDQFGSGLTSEDFLDEQCKRIQKALSRKQRKVLEEAAENYASQSKIDFGRWCRSARRTATRVSLLLCDDLWSSVEALKMSERDLANLEGAALVESSELVSDLFSFWMSPAAFHLRSHCGLRDDPTVVS